MASVLLVTNDAAVVQLTTQTLGRLGHEVVCASGPEDGIRASTSVRADIVVLDESAMDAGVFDSLSEWLRGRDDSRPIVFLSSPRQDAGSAPVRERDARLARPLSADGLRDAVAHALRWDSRLPDTMQVGEVELDGQRLEVRSSGGRVSLTPTQFKVIQFLAERQGKIVTTEDLLQAVWGDRRPDASPELLRSHLHTLRERLRGVSRSRLIENVPHRGYRIAC